MNVFVFYSFMQNGFGYFYDLNKDVMNNAGKVLKLSLATVFGC